MRLLFTSLAFFAILIVSKAQIPEDFDIANDKFLYLRDSSLLLEGQFTHERGFLKEKLYDSKGHKIKRSDLLFYNYGSGTFAHEATDGVLRLTSTGHYNIYKGYRYSSTTSSGSRTYSKAYYINQGFGSFQRVNFDLLQVRFRVFPDGFKEEAKVEVLSLLDSMKKRRRNFLYVAGSSLLATSLGALLVVNNNDDMGNTTVYNIGLGFMGVGLGGLVSLLILPKSSRLHVKTIQAYNSGF